MRKSTHPSVSCKGYFKLVGNMQAALATAPYFGWQPSTSHVLIDMQGDHDRGYVLAFGGRDKALMPDGTDPRMVFNDQYGATRWFPVARFGGKNLAIAVARELVNYYNDADADVSDLGDVAALIVRTISHVWGERPKLRRAKNCVPAAFILDTPGAQSLPHPAAKADPVATIRGVLPIIGGNTLPEDVTRSLAAVGIECVKPKRVAPVVAAPAVEPAEDEAKCEEDPDTEYAARAWDAEDAAAEREAAALAFMDEITPEKRNPTGFWMERHVRDYRIGTYNRTLTHREAQRVYRERQRTFHYERRLANRLKATSTADAARRPALREPKGNPTTTAGKATRRAEHEVAQALRIVQNQLRLMLAAGVIRQAAAVA